MKIPFLTVSSVCIKASASALCVWASTAGGDTSPHRPSCSFTQNVIKSAHSIFMRIN